MLVKTVPWIKLSTLLLSFQGVKAASIRGLAGVICLDVELGCVEGAGQN